MNIIEGRPLQKKNYTSINPFAFTAKGLINRIGSIGNQVTRIPRRGLEEGRGKDTSIYIAPRL